MSALDLPVGTKIASYKIKSLIGKGGYGSVYEAVHTCKDLTVAIKIEAKTRGGKPVKNLMMERRVLMATQFLPHFPTLYATGSKDEFNFVVMEVLNANLSDMQTLSPHKRLSRPTTARSIMQALAGIREIHSRGFLHRDIKPANFAFGLTYATRHVLKIFDFGLARRFINKRGVLLPRRESAPFRGTPRYVSIDVHRGLEQKPSDDVMSVAYAGLELLQADGILPWEKLLPDQMRVKKTLMHVTKFACLSESNLCRPFRTFLSAANLANLMERKKYARPDYTALQAVLRPMCEGRGLCDHYDWEEDWKTCHAEEKSRIHDVATN